MASRARDPARPVLAWLGDDPQCRQLALQAERMVALQSALAAVSALPGLIPLALDEDGTLKVVTTSAAAAAKLRQLEPSLVAQLVAQGWVVRRIRFRPQPLSETPAPPPAEPRAPIPAGALAQFDALARDTPAGPLKQALARLLARRGRS